MSIQLSIHINFRNVNASDFGFYNIIAIRESGPSSLSDTVRLTVEEYIPYLETGVIIGITIGALVIVLIILAVLARLRFYFKVFFKRYLAKYEPGLLYFMLLT